MKKRILVLFVLILLSSSIVLADIDEIFVTGVLRNGTNNSLIEDTLNILINITDTSGSVLYSQTQNNILIDDGIYHVIFNAITNPLWFLSLANFTLKIGDVVFPSKEIVPVPVAHASFLSNDSNYLGGILASSYYETSDGTLGNTTAEIRSQFSGSNNISIDTGVISFNASCEDITGGSGLCDGTDNTGTGSGNCSAETSCSLVSYLTGSYLTNNFSTDYYAITSRYTDANFTATESYDLTPHTNVTGGANISISSGVATLNISCEDFTGGAGLCDGIDATSTFDPDTIDYVNQTMLDNETIIRVDNTSWFNDSILWENSTGTTRLKSSQDIDMQDGDINIRDTDNEFHNLSRSLQIIDEMNRNITLSGLNGTFNSATSNLTITTITGNNIIVNIDKSESILNKNLDSILITSGTNESPILNQIIYTDVSNPVLTKRTTLGLKSPSVAAFLQGENFTYVSAIGLATVDNLVGGIFNRFFRDGSTYRSGFDINVSTNMVNISTGVINFLFDEVDIIQNHSTSDLYVHVHSDGSFDQHLTLDACSEYNDGSSISNNKYFNAVFGIAITHDGSGVMYVTVQDLPSTEYTKTIDAEVDIEDTINFFPPDDIVSLAYIPIVRVVIKRTGGVNTIQTLSNGLLFDDLRGTVTKTSSSPPPSGITAHSDLTNLDFASALHTGFVSIDGLVNNTIIRTDNTSWIYSAPHTNKTYIGSNNISISSDDVGVISINISCENITGSSELCDGDDAGTAYTAGANISLSGNVITFNMSCADFTGGAGLCDGTDNIGTGSGNCSAETSCNLISYLTGSYLTNNFSTDYYAITSRYTDANFTTAEAYTKTPHTNRTDNDITGLTMVRFVNQTWTNYTLDIELQNETIVRQQNTSWIINNQAYWNSSDAYFGLLNITTNLTLRNSSGGNQFAGIWHNGTGICIGSC